MYLATFHHCIQQCAGKGDDMPTAKLRRLLERKHECEQCTVTMLDKEY